MKPGNHTYHEITSQPEVWESALGLVRENRDALTRLGTKPYQQVIFTGCGSTYYLSLAAAALFQELTGRLARAIPAGDLLLNTPTYLTDEKNLLVAVSRSGTTTETVRAIEKFRAEKHGEIIAITNYKDTPLGAMSDISLVVAKGQEKSIAQTRSFASIYVATTAFNALAANRDDLLDSMSGLPEAGEQVLQDFEPVVRQISENLNFDRFYFLGSGIRYGLACEVNLKMKEMALTHSEPFHFLEFRHGPMSMVNEETVIVGLLSERNVRHEQAVLNEMQALGGTILSVGEKDAQIAFESGIPECAQGVLFLPALQLLAFYRSVNKGLDPDHPANLTAVVDIDPKLFS